MLNLKKIPISFEKNSVFLVNLFLVFFFMFSLMNGNSASFFFYLNVILTIILSYIFFNKSKLISKYLILTNMFLLFYFLSPQVTLFLFDLFQVNSYFILVMYNLFLASIFIFFSGNHKTFFGRIKDVSPSILLSTVLVGFFFGILFVFIQEPVSGSILNVFTGSLFVSVISITLMAFLIAFSEQLIFSGFFYNIYSKTASKDLAVIYSASLFVIFHFLRLSTIGVYYFDKYGPMSEFFILMYYMFLFSFMFSALYLYRFKSKGMEGNFVYPVTLHFVADIVLFFSYFFFI